MVDSDRETLDHLRSMIPAADDEFDELTPAEQDDLRARGSDMDSPVPST